MHREGAFEEMIIPIVPLRGTMIRTFGGAEIQAIKTTKFLIQVGIAANITESNADAGKLLV